MTPTREEFSDLVERLHRQSRRLTGPRQAILGALRQHRQPMSSQEIHAALRDAGCNLATVYRTMHILAEAGVVRRIDLGDRVSRYELAREGSHHHHLICTQCSEVVEIDECFTRGLEEGLARRHNFRSVTHRLDFFGVCPACQ